MSGLAEQTAVPRDIGFFEWFFDKSSIDNVHEPARRAAAIKQRCRTANDLNTLGKQPFDSRLVIFAERRCVKRVEPVGKDPHALAELTAYDGPG